MVISTFLLQTTNNYQPIIKKPGQAGSSAIARTTQDEAISHYLAA
ncbi:hypothetical protein OGM63_25595 [Plectonema radiosum NIES-515]|uniref:Uncharacterized protein n=1 Tax=Plectonema radiosum NIES-515 TaxID=2986073 RepID=A0ABT3B7C9_9CYAN|nr:hypothetical protein [Plectonema radiosum]MCV3216840.1 hypothetical protein [Plectonema radiosum NIES-515]